jgi:myo-inositol 2-dehydrogenase/D-chiro-inositol 1-dehydrogenase
MSSLGIGVIGAGIMGADHALNLHRFVRGAEVSRVSDLDHDRATALTDQIAGAKPTADPVALVHDDAVDAVLIASADATHAALVQECLAARKPVLCEKPLAPTAEECRGLAEAERAAVGEGVPLVSVGFMRRFDPGYTEMRDRLRSGAVGTPVLVHCVSRGLAAPNATSELSITGSAVHEFDTVPWLLGSPITAVSWHAPRSVTPRGTLQDPQVLLLHSADGVLTTVEVFLNAGYGYDIRCELVGTQGTVSLAEPVRTVVDTHLARGTAYAADWRPRFADAYRLQLQAWVDATLAGTPTPLATADEGWRATLVAETAIAAMHAGDGRAVAVPTRPAVAP